MKQEAQRSEHRHATGVNLLAFSVAMLRHRTYRGRLVNWAKCLHLGGSQVVSDYVHTVPDRFLLGFKSFSDTE